MMERHPNVWCNVGPILKHMQHKNTANTEAVKLHHAWREMMRDFPDRICLGTDTYSWAALQEDAYRKVHEAFHELVDHLPPEQAQGIGVFAHRPAEPAGLNAGHADLPMGKNIAKDNYRRIMDRKELR